jgi:hypothetical protein
MLLRLHRFDLKSLMPSQSKLSATCCQTKSWWRLRPACLSCHPTYVYVDSENDSNKRSPSSTVVLKNLTSNSSKRSHSGSRKVYSGSRSGDGICTINLNVVMPGFASKYKSVLRSWILNKVSVNYSLSVYIPFAETFSGRRTSLHPVCGDFFRTTALAYLRSLLAVVNFSPIISTVRPAGNPNSILSSFC